jgi:hypothetical protein
MQAQAMSPLRRWAVQGARAGCADGDARPRRAHDLRRGPGSRCGAFDGFASLVQAWSGELQNRRACTPRGGAAWLPDGPHGTRDLRAGQRNAGHDRCRYREPVFFGMIRGAERAASDRGFTMLMMETLESEEVERAALDRLIPAVNGVILSSSHVGFGDSFGRQAQTTGAAQPDGQRGVIGGE